MMLLLFFYCCCCFYCYCYCFDGAAAGEVVEVVEVAEVAEVVDVVARTASLEYYWCDEEHCVDYSQLIVSQGHQGVYRFGLGGAFRLSAMHALGASKPMEFFGPESVFCGVEVVQQECGGRSGYRGML